MDLQGMTDRELNDLRALERLQLRMIPQTA